MPIKKRIAIVIEGGIIQSVLSNENLSEYEVLIIDYDNDYLQDDEITMVPQGDGSSVEAYCQITKIHKPGIDIESILKQST